MTAKKTKTETNSFDVFDIDPIGACQAGADLELTHPAKGFPLGVFLQIVGMESEEFKAHTKALTREQAIKKKGFRQLSDEERAMQAIDDILSKKSAVQTARACTTGWWRYQSVDDDGNGVGRIESLLFAGEELPFTPENMRRVFTERPWMAEQAVSGIGNLGNFMKG